MLGLAEQAVPALAAMAVTALAQASESGCSYHCQRLRQGRLIKVQGLRESEASEPFSAFYSILPPVTLGGPYSEVLSRDEAF